MGAFLLNAAMSGPVLVPGYVAIFAIKLDPGSRQMRPKLALAVSLLVSAR